MKHIKGENMRQKNSLCLDGWERGFQRGDFKHSPEKDRGMNHFIWWKANLRGNAQREGPQVGGCCLGSRNKRARAPGTVSDREEGHGKDASMWRSGHVSHKQDFKCGGKPLGV